LTFDIKNGVDTALGEWSRWIKIWKLSIPIFNKPDSVYGLKIWALKYLSNGSNLLTALTAPFFQYGRDMCKVSLGTSQKTVWWNI